MKIPAPNSSSSTIEKLEYVKDLIVEARETGDIDVAFKLIDFLWDSCLITDYISTRKTLNKRFLIDTKILVQANKDRNIEHWDAEESLRTRYVLRRIDDELGKRRLEYYYY